jgi:hypothetical protein
MIIPRRLARAALLAAFAGPLLPAAPAPAQWGAPMPPMPPLGYGLPPAGPPPPPHPYWRERLRWQREWEAFEAGREAERRAQEARRWRRHERWERGRRWGDGR